MTAHKKIKIQYGISSKKILVRSNHFYSKKIKLFKIAIEMQKEKLPANFIVEVVKAALEFEGIADLLALWSGEDNKQEKEEIISDIQDMLDACGQAKKEEIYIKFNDLEKISHDIRAFKDSLYQKVMEYGGISKLAASTGIPQPSLSRFFNSPAMPRRSTVLKIAKAINLQEIKIDNLWCK